MSYKNLAIHFRTFELASANIYPIYKIINDHLVELLGSGVAELDLSKKPTVIMMVGLHGSGKTTTSAKLARHIKLVNNKNVMMVAADVYRPAAIDQLEILGKEISGGTHPYGTEQALNITRKSLELQRKADLA
jgi:signal recognition particle subunit SRP54